ncbi:MAG: hypothetical protein AB1757_00420 [Acidobacteriota bacterium]
MSKKTEEELLEFIERNAVKYLDLPNVTSVGVAYKIKDLQLTDELAIRFTVKNKLSIERLEAEGMQPLPSAFIDQDDVAIPTDVVARSYRLSHKILNEATLPEPLPTLAAAEPSRRSRFSTLRPGISVGNISLSLSGTIGAIVYDALNGTPYLLSNWHILCGEQGKAGNKIVQPSKNDSNQVFSNLTGKLIRSHLGIEGDCAIASISERGINENILGLNITPRRIAIPNLNDKVVKSGRTTAVTYGIVNCLGIFKNNYQGSLGERQVAGFEIRPNPDKKPLTGEISGSGDSGSLWLIDTDTDEKNVAVGLHFAGEAAHNPAEHALACNIDSVFQMLQISFVNPLIPFLNRH